MGAGVTATERVDASAMLGIGTALLYAATAISMNFVNKATLDVGPSPPPRRPPSSPKIPESS